MDIVITARIPQEVKEFAVLKLREMGSSPTELINAAFDYFLATGKLPDPHQVSGPECITLTPEQINELRLRFDQTTCTIPDSYWNERS
jgi:antitoxin component of RelBE/YafQ-DinJ toxin-antitoxin module